MWKKSSPPYALKQVNSLQRSSVKNKYLKERIEAKVVIYMCLLKIKIIAIDFNRLIIDKY